MSDPAIFDVVLEALVRQHQHPSENGGGMIGMAGAVVKALGLDGDQPRSFLQAPHYLDPDREDPSWRLTRLQACPRCGAPAAFAADRSPRMSEHLDRALEALDAGIELAAAPADSSRGWGPYGADSLDLCWRCVARLGAEPSGLCGPCLTIMRDDDYVAPDDTSEADLAESAARFFYTTPAAARVMLGLPDSRPDDQVDLAAATVQSALQRAEYRVDRAASERIRTQALELLRAQASVIDSVTRAFLAAGRSMSGLARALGSAYPRPSVPAKPAHRRKYRRR